MEMEEEKKIDFASIEKKWQREWEKSKIFEAKEGSRSNAKAKKRPGIVYWGCQ